MDDYLIRAVIVGLFVALIAGPMGSIVVWKRMSFFGDALSHSALIGIVSGFFLGINPVIGIFIICCFVSLLIVRMQKVKILANDTLLGIISHATLAAGLVSVYFFDEMRVNLFSFLMGDILAVTQNDIIFIVGVSILSMLLLIFVWRPLLLGIINEDLAIAEGINLDKYKVVFMVLLSLVVAISIKIIGILLVTSLLIIPPAFARIFSSTPERMAIIASFGGIVSVMSGIYSSYSLDVPTGPAIVLSAVLLFVVTKIIYFVRA